MRDYSEELERTLTGGEFNILYEGDLYYDNDRLAQNIPLESVELSWDGSAEIEGSGSAVIVWEDPNGLSVRPGTAGDMFAPYGTILKIYVTISMGSAFYERLAMGVYDITEVPVSEDSVFVADGISYVQSTRIKVELKDRMVEVARDRFVQLASPQAGLNVYEEIHRITGLPIRRTVANKLINRQVVYEEDRVKAVQDLADIIGQVAFMDSDGVLSFRSPDPASTAIGALTIGEYGTIVQVGSALSSDTVYNGVIIRGETQDNTTPILAERWVTSGPLRATMGTAERTPYHRVPRFYSSPQVTTQGQADAIIDDLLARWSSPSAAQLEITCIYDPRIQLGDTVSVWDGVDTWTIHVQEVQLGMNPTMVVRGDVVRRA